MKRIKHHEELYRYLAIFITSVVFGASTAVIVFSVFPHVEPWYHAVAISITVAVTLVVVWLA